MKRFVLLFTLLLSTGLLSCQQKNTLTPKEGFVSVTGGKVWYRILGSGDKTPIVLLHGGPAYPSYYLNPLAPLSKDRPVIWFDQLGCGRSDRITDTTLMTIASYAEQTQQLVNQLNLKEFYLYGHSTGTMIAVDYYLKYPQKIKGLILVGPVLSTKAYMKDLDAAVAAMPDSIQKIITESKVTKDWQSEAYQKVWSFFNQQYFLRKQEPDAHLDSASRQYAAHIHDFMWGIAEFSATGNMKDYERANDLQKIKIPTLYLRGEFEQIDNSIHYYQSQTPNSRLVEIPKAGHFTMIDNPEGEIQAISEFMDELKKNNHHSLVLHFPAPPIFFIESLTFSNFF